MRSSGRRRRVTFGRVEREFAHTLLLLIFHPTSYNDLLKYEKIRRKIRHRSSNEQKYIQNIGYSSAEIRKVRLLRYGLRQLASGGLEVLKRCAAVLHGNRMDGFED